MVTVTTTKEELTAPVQNGFAGIAISDNDRLFQLIKDYQEVDFGQTPSPKPLPKYLFETVDGEVPKSSIKGTFLVQIISIEPLNSIDQNQKGNKFDRHPSNQSLLLKVTDGYRTVQAINHGDIPNLNSFNVEPGSKLLLTDVIPIQDAHLQLTQQNTSFQNGSKTYRQPRSSYRGRTNGSSRGPYEGRRNRRYDNEDGESNFFTRLPSRTTLSDFITGFMPANDLDNEKVKERNSNSKRRSNYESNSQTIKNNYHTNAYTNHSSHYSINNNHATNSIHHDQMVFEQGNVDETYDVDEDGAHSAHRERRNPLPPRLQRAQEERFRRNPGRYGDESSGLIGNELNNIYRNDLNGTAGLSSSSSSYMRRDDTAAYLPAYPNMMATMNGSAAPHLAYFTPSSNTLQYAITGVPNSNYANQPISIGSGYGNEPVSYCYGAPYPIHPYIPTNLVTDTSNESQDSGDTSAVNGSIDEDEKKNSQFESSNDENNDSGIKQDVSSGETKSTQPTVPPVTESNQSSKRINHEEPEEKRRTMNNNPRPRWKIGDMCFARWSEDRELYYAMVVQITPPYCTVLFCDYNTYDQVHFNDMEMIPHDPACYQYVPTSLLPTSDFNSFAPSNYLTQRPEYYGQAIDGCVLMPEAPPFPFNPDGTQYICPPSLTQVSIRPLRTNTNGFQSQNRRNEYSNSTINSSSPPSKDSNDTTAIDSTKISTEDQQQQHVDQETLSSSSVDLKTPQANLVNLNDTSVPVGDVKIVNDEQRLTENKTQQKDITTNEENK